MALLADVAAIKTAADLLEAGETSSWQISEAQLEEDKLAFETWVSAVNAYSVSVSELFTEADEVEWDRFRKINTVTHGSRYFMITCSYPEASV